MRTSLHFPTLCLRSVDSSPLVSSLVLLWIGLCTCLAGPPAIQQFGLGNVRDLAWSRDGKILITGGDAGACAWDTQTWKLRGFLRSGQHQVRSVATYVSVGGSRAATYGDAGLIVWDLETLQPLLKEPKLRSTYVGGADLCVSTNGSILALRRAGFPSPQVYEFDEQLRSRVTLYGPGDFESCMAMPPDGTLVASASFQGTLSVYRIADGQKLWRISKGAELPFNCLAFSLDGAQLACGLMDSRGVVLYYSNGFEFGRLTGIAGVVKAVSFDPEGRWLAVAHEDGSLSLWDVQSQTLVWKSSAGPLQESGYYYYQNGAAVEFSPDGTRVAVSLFPESITIYAVTNGQQLARLEGHMGQVNSVGISLDGKLAMVSSPAGNSSADIYDAKTGARLRRLGVRAPASGSFDSTLQAAFSPTSPRLATVNYERCDLWDPETGTRLASYVPPGGMSFNAACWSRDGQYLAVSGGGGFVVLNSSGGLLSIHSEPDTALNGRPCFSPDAVKLAFGRFSFAGGGDVVTGMRIGSGLSQLTAHAFFPPECVDWAPDGGTIIYAPADNGGINFVDPSTGAILAGITNHPLVHMCAYSRDGKSILSASEEGTVKLWETATKNEIETYSTIPFDTEQPLTIQNGRYDITGAKALSVAASQDGTQLVVGTSAGTAWLFGMATAAPARPPVIIDHPHSQYVARGNSAVLAVVTENGSVRSYQWFEGDAGETNRPVGRNAPRFLTPPVTRNVSYWVRVSTAAGAADSLPAQISAVQSDLVTTSLWTWSMPSNFPYVSALAFSPDGAVLAVAVCDDRDGGRIDLIDMNSKSLIAGLGNQRCTKLLFSADGMSLWANAPWSLNVWDVPNRRVTATYTGLDGELFAVSADGGLALGVPHGEGWAFSTLSPSANRWVAGPSLGRAETVAGSIGAEVLGAASYTESFTDRFGDVVFTCPLRVWDVQAGAMRWEWPGIDANRISAMGFSPDGSKLVVCFWSSGVRVYDSRTGTLIAQPVPPGIQILNMALAADGKHLAVDTGSGVQLYDGTVPIPRRTFKNPNAVSFEAYLPTLSPDLTRLVTWSQTERALKFWDTSLPKVTPIIPSLTLDSDSTRCWRVYVLGADAVSYRLEYSTDLIHWQPSGLWFQPRDSGRIPCSQLPDSDRRFFRVVQE